MTKTEKTMPVQKSISTLSASNRLTSPVIVTTNMPKEMLIATRKVFNISLISSSLLMGGFIFVVSVVANEYQSNINWK